MDNFVLLQLLLLSIAFLFIMRVIVWNNENINPRHIFILNGISNCTVAGNVERMLILSGTAFYVLFFYEKFILHKKT